MSPYVAYMYVAKVAVGKYHIIIGVRFCALLVLDWMG